MDLSEPWAGVDSLLPPHLHLPQQVYKDTSSSLGPQTDASEESIGGSNYYGGSRKSAPKSTGQEYSSLWGIQYDALERLFMPHVALQLSAVLNAIP